MSAEIFPFGATSVPRPPRVPEVAAKAFVLGVYPSALHVRWTLPSWAAARFGRGSINSLAVDVEPVVFWDGRDPAVEDLVARWAEEHFPGAADPERFGTVAPGMNGTSGHKIAAGILAPLGLPLTEMWMTDAVNRFFVKRGSVKRTHQADVIDNIYAPFAAQAGLPQASLPPRPTSSALVTMATTREGRRLADEWEEASAPLLITLGEEARRVAERLAETSNGPPTRPLTSGDPDYGRPGRIGIADHTADWMALTHPGNASAQWRSARHQWATWAEHQS